MIWELFLLTHKIKNFIGVGGGGGGKWQTDVMGKRIGEWQFVSVIPENILRRGRVASRSRFLEEVSLYKKQF